MSFIENLRRNILFRKFRNWLSNLMYGDSHMFISDAYAERMTKMLEETGENVVNAVYTDVSPSDPQLSNKVTSTISNGIGVVAFVMKRHGLEDLDITYKDGALDEKIVRAKITILS